METNNDRGAFLAAYAYHRGQLRHYEGRPPHAKASDARKRYKAPIGAAEAARLARADLAAGVRRYAESGLASYQNAPNDRGGRWIERPDLAGLRFIGFADKLASLDHTGWFQHPGGDPGDVFRAAVYQLPARGGRACYVEAYVSGESIGRDDFRETSTGRKDSEHRWPAVIFLAERHLGELGGAEGDKGDDSAIRDAARGADREAEFAAEREREYQDSYAAGRQAAEAIEEAKAERESARAILAELRGKAGADMPASCAALRSSVRASLARARRKYAKAAELFAENTGFRLHSRGAELESAFADGAGGADYWSARK